MVDKLESPRDLPGARAKRDDRVGPFPVAGAEAAEIVGTGTTSGDKDKMPVGIDGHDGPGVGGATAPRMRRVCGVWHVGWNGIPAPAQFPGSRVKRAHQT